MRLRACKVCGARFQATGEQRLCENCRKAARAESVMRDRTCRACARVFLGGPRAFYCPECREERRRAAKAAYEQRASAGKVRSIGSTDICRSCGGEYVVAGGLQQYCPACAAEAVRSKVLPQKRARAAEHRGETEARKAEFKQGSAVCAYCGKTFTANSPSVTCSAECAREYQRITMGMVDYRRGRRKTAPAHDRYSSGLPQSELPGVTYNRRREKWEVRHKGKYIGLYPTKEEAEAKKMQLLRPEQPSQ